MTTIDTFTEVPVRLDFERHADAFYKAMVHLDHAATKELDRVGFDRRLRELVRIRASQINGCAYCIDMHTKDARALGETEQRIYSLPAWRETPFFTERERAALAFTESVTLLAEDHVPTEAYEAVAAYFDPDEIAALVALIVTINAWNGIAVSTRAWPPGSYQPVRRSRWRAAGAPTALHRQELLQRTRLRRRRSRRHVRWRRSCRR